MNQPSRAPSTDFTRGWELLGHFLQMLKASFLRHVAASLCVGLTWAALWLVRDLGPERAAELPRYVALETQRSPARFGERDRFDGRPLPFLLQQLALRAGAMSAIAFLLGAVLVARHGRTIRERKRLRGVELRERVREPFARRRAGEIGAVTLGAAAAFALSVAELGPRRASLFDYATASATSASPRLARFLSPDGEGVIAWYDGAQFHGLCPNAEVKAALETTFGRPFTGLLLTLVGRIAAFALFALPLLSVARRSLRGRSNPSSAPWRLAGVPISDDKACYHFLFCGSPGSGKSTAIKDLLDQIRERSKRAIVYDLSGEYVELFYRSDKDLILNPLDRRSEIWTPWAEVRAESDYTLLARSLFPPGGQEPFWADASATLFASTMKALHETGRKTNRDLYQALTHLALEDLHDFLEGTQAARLLDPNAGAMPSNLIATVTSKLAAWPSLPDPGPTDRVFSIRDFVHRPDDDAWLFLSTSEDQRALLKPLLSLWSDIAATAILTLDKAHESKIWFVLDEVASLQKLPALPGLLERGRKHGCAALLGLQAMPQLEDAYGTKLARAISSQPQTWLVLRSVEPETARFLESALGQTEYVEAQTSYSMGAHPQRDGVSLQERIATRPVALASEISSLPDLSGFLKLPGGHEVFRVSYRHRERPIVAAAFEARKA